MDCQICHKHKADRRDYRFIDSCGLQGKVYACNWCFNLNDESIKETVSYTHLTLPTTPYV